MFFFKIEFIKTAWKAVVIFACLFYASNMMSQNALHFNDWVQPNVNSTVFFNSPFQFNGASGLTIEAWVRIPSQVIPPLGSNYDIVTLYANSGLVQTTVFEINLNDSFAVKTRVLTSVLEGNTAINDSNWHHVAIVFQANQHNSLHVYIDGILDKIGGGGGANLSNVISGHLRIGTKMNGCIDELRVWRKALSQSEIVSNMYEEICQLPAELLVYFKFNEGVANGPNYGLNLTLDEVSKQNAILNGGFALNGNTSNFVTGSGITPRSNFVKIHTVDTCDTYTVTGPSGQFYNLSGTYYDTLTSYLDCDSVIRTDLTYHNLNTNVVVNQYTMDASQKNASYRWMDCDNNYAFINGINGMSQNFIPPNPKGWYAVQISAYGCVDTSACYSLKGKTTDLSEILPHLFKVYPNPSKGQITVSHPSIKNGSISVYDITGRVVLSIKDLGDEETIIELSSQPNGVYFVKLEADAESLVDRVILE